MEKLLFNTRSAAEVLGVARHTMIKWRQLGGGPAFKKIGRSVRYEKAALEAWINSHPTIEVFPKRKKIKPEILATMEW